MARIGKHFELGFRWARCGWRLFRRNPWLLGGMGCCCSALVGALVLLPFIGTALIGLLAPALLAGVYRALDATAKQQLPLPAALRLAALKQSPRELAAVLRDETRVLQIVMFGLLCVVVVVLTNVSMWLVAGSSWSHGGALQLAAVPRVLAAVMLGGAIYALLAALLMYAVPLALFAGEPLVAAMSRSFMAARRHPLAYLVLAALLLTPLLLGTVVFSFSAVIACVVGVAVGALVLPVAVGGLYCSYRAFFTGREIPRPVRVAPKARGARTAA